MDDLDVPLATGDRAKGGPEPPRGAALCLCQVLRLCRLSPPPPQRGRSHESGSAYLLTLTGNVPSTDYLGTT
jgi:hypothetical protein